MEAQQQNMVPWDSLLAPRGRGWPRMHVSRQRPWSLAQLKPLYDRLLLCFFTVLPPPGRNDNWLLECATSFARPLAAAAT